MANLIAVIGRADTAASMERLLRRTLQVDIYTTTEYAAARAAIKNSKVDLLIIDLGGEDAPGTKLIREVRANLRLRLVPVIALTTSCFDETKPSAAYDAGANVVMQIPVSIDELSAQSGKLLKLAIDPDLALVYAGLETPGFDYKERLELETKEGCACLAKDIIAMANWGGGTIVVGFRESEPGQFTPIGVDVAKLPLFEPTRLNKAISEFLDPSVSVSVRRVADGKHIFAVLNIPGITDTIIFAKKENPHASLYKGRIYSRTSRMESAELQSADEVRRLIARLHEVNKGDATKHVLTIRPGHLMTETGVLNADGNVTILWSIGNDSAPQAEIHNVKVEINTNKRYLVQHSPPPTREKTYKNETTVFYEMWLPLLHKNDGGMFLRMEFKPPPVGEEIVVRYAAVASEIEWQHGAWSILNDGTTIDFKKYPRPGPLKDEENETGDQS